MKKLLILCALSAIAANLHGAASTPWDYNGPIYGGDNYRVVDPMVSGALGTLLRAFLYKVDKNSALGLASNHFEQTVRAAAQTGDFDMLESLGRSFADAQVGGVTLAEWIALAKQGRIPAFATSY